LVSIDKGNPSSPPIPVPYLEVRDRPVPPDWRSRFFNDLREPLRPAHRARLVQY
jgi:hypothetical protein